MSEFSANELQINTRYVLKSKVGHGGMGMVYRAYDRLTRQSVALKQVKMPDVGQSDNSELESPSLMLAREFRALAGLRHPNIISVLDYGFDVNQQPYYTMQLHEGAVPIDAYATELDDAAKVELMLDLLRALVPFCIAATSSIAT